MQRDEEEVRGLREMGTIDWIYGVRQGEVHSMATFLGSLQRT